MSISSVDLRHLAVSSVNYFFPGTIPAYTSSTSPYLNLEQIFEGESLKYENNASPGDNLAYYEFPNEFYPIQLSPLLETTEEGLHVSVGSLRSIFGFLLSKKCTGLVVRDTNSKIKAYLDFLKCLAYIAKNREEFCRLAMATDKDNTEFGSCKMFGTSELRKRKAAPLIDEIRAKVRESDMSPVMKAYYEKHLSEFAEIFYTGSRRIIIERGRYCHWSEEWAFEDVNFFKHDHLFYKLKEAVLSGAIIATIGSINDLNFLKDQKISLVDTSNVHDYCVVDLQGINPHYPPPLIVWTSRPIPPAPSTLEYYFPFLSPRCYFSSYQPSEEQREKFHQLCKKFFDVTNPSWTNFRLFMVHHIWNKMSALELKNDPPFTGCSLSVIKKMEALAASTLLTSGPL